ALIEQVVEALVGLLGGAETGEHAHRPGAGAVHRRLDAAGVGVFAGEAEIALVVEPLAVFGGVEPLDGHAGLRAGQLALGHAGGVGGDAGDGVGAVERPLTTPSGVGRAG